MSNLSSYESAVLNNTPSIYYEMQETTGTTSADASGHASNGTYSGGFTLGQTGPPMGGTSVLLNGSSGYMSSPANVSFTSTDYVMTVELWFKTTSTGTIPMITGNTTGPTENAIVLMVAGQIQVQNWVSSSSTSASPTTTGKYNDGNWHMLTVTWSTSGTVIYVDGSPVVTDSSVSAQGFTGHWSIGYSNNNYWSLTSNYFSGSVAHFAAWNTTALTATQVSNHYNAATGGSSTPQGTISASGTSSATVSGYPVPIGKISANGTASASVSGTAIIESSISASGTGSVSITGTNVIVGSISASGTSSASVTGTAIVEGSITASGTSSVSVTGSAVSGDSISAQGTSSASVSGFAVPIGQISAQGTSSVGVNGHTIVTGSISAQGTSSASVSGTAVSNASITASGTSSVSISGFPIVTASITAQGVSSVTIESSGAVFGSITAGGTSVVDIEGHTIIVGQIDAQGTATVVVSTAKPIRAVINLASSLDNKPSLASSLDNKPSLTSSLDNRINLMSGVTPLAAVNQDFKLWQYSSDQITFTHSGDLSGSTLEWIMQPNVLSATPTIKKTSADGSISITSTSSTQSVFTVSITNTDMNPTGGSPIGQGQYYHQASLVDALGESNPISTGTVTVSAASNN